VFQSSFEDLFFSFISFQPCKNQPKNWERLMHPMQKSAPKLRHVYATPAKSSPRSEARLCTPCKSLPQIWGTFMHPMHNSPPKLRHVYAPHAKSSPKTEARLCTPCIIFSQNWGTFMHPMHKSLPVFRQVFQVLEWFFTDLGQGFQVFGWSVSDLTHIILFCKRSALNLGEDRVEHVNVLPINKSSPASDGWG